MKKSKTALCEDNVKFVGPGLYLILNVADPSAHTLDAHDERDTGAVLATLLDLPATFSPHLSRGQTF